MHALDPGALAWLGLLAPVLLLFLVRRRPRVARVSTLAFFKTLARAYQEAPWLRRLKRLLALLLAVLTVATATGALAHLVRAPRPGQVRSVVLVVDRSASMAARPPGGPSRWEQAREDLRERLAGVDAAVSVLVLAYGRRPEIVVPFTRDRRALAAALSDLAPRPEEGDAEAALALAARLARLEPPAEIWHVGDDPAPDPAGAPEEVPLAERLDLGEEVRLVTLPAGGAVARNAGITALALRPRPLEHGQLEAFVEILASGAAPFEARLVAARDGTEVALRHLTLTPGTPTRLLLPLAAGAGGLLRVAVECAEDGLALDDVAFARIPALRPRRLLWVRAQPDPFTHLAFLALAEKQVLEAFALEPGQWPPADLGAFDLLVLDGWLPPTWPADLPALVIEPPESRGPVEAVPIEGGGLAVERLRAVDERHPLLFGVANDRLALTQVSALGTPAPLQPLWTGPAGPLLVAGEVRGQRLVVLGVSPQRSERLALLPSFPLLLGNAVLWLTRAEDEARREGVYPGGSVVEVPEPRIEWWDGRAEPGAPAPATWEGRDLGEARVAELDRVGVWRSGARSGTAALLSRRETAAAAPGAATTPPPAPAGLRGDLRGPLLWLLLLLLLLEAWLFHRHGVR